MEVISANWFECSVRYELTQDNGSVKKVTKQYVVDAQSFAEAEDRITNKMQPYIIGDFDVVGIKPAPYSEIAFVENVDNTKFYKVKVAFVSLDEKSGEEKFSNHLYLIEAKSLRGALDNIDDLFKKLLFDYVSVNVNETKIIDVFRHEKEMNKTK